MLSNSRRWLHLTEILVLLVANVYSSSLEQNPIKNDLTRTPDAVPGGEHGSATNQSWFTERTCSTNTPLYCVYTSTKFANGRGLSMLVTPEQADGITSLAAFTEPSVHHNLGINQHSNPPFEARQISGHGTGLIANRTIQSGEWLMSFTPAFFKARQSHDDLSFRERRKLQQLAFQRLPLPLRDTANNLYGQSEGQADHVNDILETNSFALSIPLFEDDDGETEDVNFDFLFPEIARLNHNCRPSADYFFDIETLTLHIVAFRPIFAGEEITITYIDPLQRRRSRQKALHRSWGFKCDCASCTDSTSEGEASDARIEQIMELQEELDDRSPESSADPAMAEKILSLLRQEQLWTLIPSAYGAAAIEFSGVGDSINAKRYAAMGLQSGMVCRASDNYNDDYRSLQDLVDDPQSHASWMFRSSSR